MGKAQQLAMTTDYSIARHYANHLPSSFLLSWASKGMVTNFSA